jgi:hypothetical protein
MEVQYNSLFVAVATSAATPVGVMDPLVRVGTLGSGSLPT